MYASAADALLGLLEGKEGGSPTKITSMPPGIKYLINGIKYFAVQVTSESGEQYGISGYDVEAEELYQVAMSKFKDHEPVQMMVMAKRG